MMEFRVIRKQTIQYQGINKLIKKFKLKIVMVFDVVQNKMDEK